MALHLGDSELLLHCIFTSSICSFQKLWEGTTVFPIAAWDILCPQSILTTGCGKKVLFGLRNMPFNFLLKKNLGGKIQEDKTKRDRNGFWGTVFYCNESVWRKSWPSKPQFLSLLHPVRISCPKSSLNPPFSSFSLSTWTLSPENKLRQGPQSPHVRQYRSLKSHSFSEQESLLFLSDCGFQTVVHMQTTWGTC